LIDGKINMAYAFSIGKTPSFCFATDAINTFFFVKTSPFGTETSKHWRGV